MPHRHKYASSDQLTPEEVRKYKQLQSAFVISVAVLVLSLLASIVFSGNETVSLWIVGVMAVSGVAVIVSLLFALTSPSSKRKRKGWVSHRRP